MDKASNVVIELFKIVIATSGIILALLWGLVNKEGLEYKLIFIQIASVVLIIAIASSLLGLQFIVSAIQRNSPAPSRVGSVAICFFIGWFGFLIGCVALLAAIFNV